MAGEAPPLSPIRSRLPRTPCGRIQAPLVSNSTKGLRAPLLSVEDEACSRYIRIAKRAIKLCLQPSQLEPSRASSPELLSTSGPASFGIFVETQKATMQFTQACLFTFVALAAAHGHFADVPACAVSLFPVIFISIDQYHLASLRSLPPSGMRHGPSLYL